MTGIHQLLFSSFAAPAAELQTIIVNSTETITIPAGVTKLDRWLVVAGGGGGGRSTGANNGGGAGAGGMRFGTNLTISAGSTVVSVGEGGDGGIQSTSTATNGGDSSIAQGGSTIVLSSGGARG